MTNEERKVLELALDWIEKQPEETLDSKYDVDTRYVVIREIEAALAQSEQEPVALKPCWYESKQEKMCRKCGQVHAEAISPPQRKPLTDEQIWDLHIKMSAALNCKLSDLIELTRAVEAAHGIKE